MQEQDGAEQDGAGQVEAMMRNVVEMLVDRPEAVSLSREVDENNGLTYHVQVDPADVGKLIGVNGRTARSLRIILGCAGRRFRLSTSLNIVQV